MGRSINGVPNWSELHQIMREQLVFNHYLEPVFDFMRKETPDVFEYVETQAATFIPDIKIRSFAKSFEGLDHIAASPYFIAAEAKSGSRHKMAALVAGLAHEAKHFELFTYKLKKKHLSDGMDPVLAQSGFNVLFKIENWTHLKLKSGQ